jgi:hypothetical protein
MDERAAVDELAARFLEGVDGRARDEALALLREFLGLWKPDGDVREWLETRKEELDEALGQVSPKERVGALRVYVTGRAIDRLSVKTWELGCAIIDGKIDVENGREQGRLLQAEVQQLTHRMNLLGDQVTRSMRRSFEEAFLEALFAVAGGATSLRMGRYQSDRGR